MIRILQLELPDSPVPAGTFAVRLELDVEGATDWYEVTVHPSLLGSLEARPMVPDQRLQAQLGGAVLRQIEQFVSQALRAGSVHLPQLLAA